MRVWAVDTILALIAVPTVVLAGESSASKVAVSDFDSIKLYTLKNKAGMEVKVTNYGAIIASIVVPDRTSLQL